MVPFEETIKTKKELIEVCKRGFEDFSNKRISKNDFCMYFGFTHGQAITTFYKGNYEQLLIDGGFNTGSEAYFAGGINAWKNLRDGKYVFPPLVPNVSRPSIKNGQALQQIFYGAPGTGKSHAIKEQTEGKQVIRTTFHPDSDYSTFVGAYKPTTKEIPMRDVTGKVIIENGKAVTENRIVYEFVEQSFLQAYTKAWNAFANTEEGSNAENIYLVIEEINRGNCAQIFGDLFQLLDRGDNGFSEYPIVADKDLQKQLAKAFETMPDFTVPTIGSMSAEEAALKIKTGEILLLPSNLYIWATMNTSDQSLFPIDSAFKRRWDWKYIPIDTKADNWSISAAGATYDWGDFLEKINAKIEAATSSEDKMLGFYFCKAENGTITAERFVNTVIFYLWNDVFKDYGLDDSIFNDENNEKLTFKKFYQANGNVDECKVQLCLQNLQVQENSNPIVSDIDEEKSTGISDKQARFWTGFNQARENNAEYSQIYTKRTPAAEAWMDLSFGNSTYHPTLSVIFTKKLIRAGIWIGPSERSQEIFNHFKENETAINEIVGEQMDFSINKSSYLIKIEKTWNLDDESTWPSAYEWFMSMAIKMNDIKEKFGH